MHFVEVQRFADWRLTARRLLRSGVAPESVHWISPSSQGSLFDSNRDVCIQDPSEDPAAACELPDFESSRDCEPEHVHRVPRAFLKLAERVACHRTDERWSILYRILWRLTRGEPRLLEIETDDDVLALRRMDKAVRRDAHKMKAFVRFRRIVDEAGEHFVAWHRPDHRVVRLTAPFFSRRFSGMRWTILTPDESVVWDRHELHYGPGVSVAEAPAMDVLEDLWRTYYRSIFNPARIKLSAMKQEMPVRYWKNLPETQAIPDLLLEAPERISKMIQSKEGFEQTAADYFPKEFTLSALADAAKQCRACHLCEDATQTVPGEGPEQARMVLVGEQPGDREDVEGRPFVGPAGQVLDEAIKAAGVNRDEVYVTNTVKHFKFERRGKRRLHKKPNSREIFACRPWLEAELEVIKPPTLVCLGATAAQALFGRDFRITKQRGEFRKTDWCDQTVATWHPSMILRSPDKRRQSEMFEQLADDLRLAASGS